MKDLIRRIVRYFGPNSEYEPKDPTERPLPCPLRTSAISDIISNSLRYGLDGQNLGPTDDYNADCLCKLAPIVGIYAGHRNMLTSVEKAARITQNNTKSVAICLAAARILEHYLLKGFEKDVFTTIQNELKNPHRSSPTDEDRNVADMIQNIIDMKSRSHVDVVSHVGHSSCKWIIS